MDLSGQKEAWEILIPQARSSRHATEEAEARDLAEDIIFDAIEEWSRRKSYDRHGSGPLISITSKRSMDQDTQWTPISSSVRRTSACMWPIRNTRRGLGGERVTTFEAASEARSLSPLLYRRLFVACQRDGPSQLSVCKVLEDPVQYKMEAVSHIRLGLDSHEFFVCKGVLAVQSPEFSRHPRRTAV